MAEEPSPEHEAYPVIRLLAPFGAPVSAGVVWVFGRPTWQAVVLTVVYLIAFAIWQFVDVWLVPVLRADSTRRARRMLSDIDVQPSSRARGQRAKRR